MTEDRIKVSVIVPIYNVEKYLPECLDSILNQTFSNYELILVDDGATDTSGEICERYAAHDNRIKIIHKENGGLSSARNAGINVAVGDYIAFIDSDDAVHPDYLRDMVSIAETQEADLVACHFVKGKDCVWEEADDTLDIRIGREILNRMNDDDVTVTVAWNKLYHRKFFHDYGLRYPEGKIHEDMFLTPQVLYHANKMVITSRKLYFYRQRPDSIMTAAFSLKQLQVLESVEFRIGFFSKIDYPDLVVSEYEGYIRKLIQMYGKMSMENNEKYKKQMDEIIEKARSVYNNKAVFRKIHFKHKVKLIKFIWLH